MLGRIYCNHFVSFLFINLSYQVTDNCLKRRKSRGLSLAPKMCHKPDLRSSWGHLTNVNVKLQKKNDIFMLSPFFLREETSEAHTNDTGFLWTKVLSWPDPDPRSFDKVKVIWSSPWLFCAWFIMFKICVFRIPPRLLPWLMDSGLETLIFAIKTGQFPTTFSHLLP